MANLPLHLQRYNLPFKAVHLQCLDHDKKPIQKCVASGLLRRESDQLFLYTCWHFVTGFDKNDIKVSHELPNRGFIRVTLQGAQLDQPGIEVIGENQSLTIPLYDTSTKPLQPLWSQDDMDIPHPDLSAINIRVPFWHDAVKLRLPSDLQISDVQLVPETPYFADIPQAGEPVFLVGYPYGYSAVGAKQPTPVVLTRHVAAMRVEDRQQELLLDGPGAPGMSGGPVFIERNSQLLVLGLYTGLIYPDHIVEQNEKTTALGTCSNMVMCWGGHSLKPYV